MKKKTTFRNKSSQTIGKGAVTVILLVLLDQITKYFAAMNLKGKEPLELIPGVFDLHYLENSSAAFGIDPISLLHKVFHFSYFDSNPEAFLRWKMGFFVIFTVIVLCLMVLVYMKVPEVRRLWMMDAIILMFMGGAIGNFIDRVVHNYVIDFFYFKVINFPIFNVADIYVTVGAFLLIFLGLFYYKEEDYDLIFPPKEKKKEDNS